MKNVEHTMRTQFCKLSTAILTLAIAFTLGCEEKSSSKSSSSADEGLSSEEAGDTFKDDRDGKSYKWVKIGEQTWMAENLNFNAEGSKCGNGSSLIDANTSTCDTYGRLYNWSTAMDIPSSYNSSFYNPSSGTKYRGVCPQGWHLPSNADWDKLYRYVDGSTGTDSPYDSPTAGTKLKASSGWNSSSGVPAGTDDYGFSALPGGYGNSDGGFGNVGYLGYWWSASENHSDDAYHRYISYLIEGVFYYDFDKSILLSVRCLQD